MSHRITVGYRVKSSDGYYVHRTSKHHLGALPGKSPLTSKADALRLMADWLDSGYLPTLVHVYASSPAVRDAREAAQIVAAARELGKPRRKRPPTGLSMQQIAERIAAHLKRFERDPKINAMIGGTNCKSYYLPGAYPGGGYIRVSYVTYQGSTRLRRGEAEAYLAWLDAGNVGRHQDAIGHLVGRWSGCG